MGRANLQGSHAIIRNGEAFVVGLMIQPFQPGNVPESHKPDRTRKLLLGKKELKTLAEKMKTGLTLVPVSLYNNKRGFLKLELGLGRGKKQFDKREVIKKRETEREIRRFHK
jgi:SsrA-binding protein